MSERLIPENDASIFRLQAMLEQLLRIQCEVYAHLAQKDYKEIMDHVLKEVDSSTKELILLHSHLKGNDNPNNN